MLYHRITQTRFIRWSLTIAAGLLLTVLALFSLIYFLTTAAKRDRMEAIAVHQTELLKAAKTEQAAERLTNWLAEDLHTIYYAGLFDASGEHLAGNLLRVPPDLIQDGHPHDALFTSIDRGQKSAPPEAVRAVATWLRDGRLLVIGVDTDDLDELQEIVVWALVISFAPLIILSLLGGVVLTMGEEGRIGQISAAVDRILQGRLDERLPVGGKGGELDKVCGSVNEMLAFVQRLIEDVRSVSDNIAHDLRTPLTRARTGLERNLRDARSWDEVERATYRGLAAIDHALLIIATILRIGEIEHGRHEEWSTPIEAAALVVDAAELYDPIAEEKGIRIEVFAEPGMVLFGDRDLLIEALSNLLDNAIKHAPVDTTVSISAGGRGRHGYIRVADRGGGIPPAERERVMQRFYRMERSRTTPGSGLGLSLVTAVATRHGFTLVIGDAAPGCAVELIFPIIEDTTFVGPSRQQWSRSDAVASPGKEAT